jgi:hypothetical protein
MRHSEPCLQLHGSYDRRHYFDAASGRTSLESGKGLVLSGGHATRFIDALHLRREHVHVSSQNPAVEEAHDVETRRFVARAQTTGRSMSTAT